MHFCTRLCIKSCLHRVCTWQTIPGFFRRSLVPREHRSKAIYGCYVCIHYLCVCSSSTCAHINLTHSHSHPSHPHPTSSSSHSHTHSHPHTSPSQWRYQVHHNRDWSQLGTTPTPPVLHGGYSKGGEKKETSYQPKYELHPVRG